MTGEQASFPHFGSKIGTSSPCIENALYEDDSMHDLFLIVFVSSLGA